MTESNVYAKVSYTASLSSRNNFSSSVWVYPNPADDHLIIKVQIPPEDIPEEPPLPNRPYTRPKRPTIKTYSYTLKVYGMADGTVKHTQHFSLSNKSENTELIQLDTSSYPEGIYFVRVVEAEEWWEELSSSIRHVTRAVIVSH